MLALQPIIQMMTKSVFMINLGNAHWVSAEVDLNSEAITFFNSMATSLRRDNNATRLHVLPFAHSPVVSRLPQDDPQSPQFHRRLVMRRKSNSAASVLDKKAMMAWKKSVVEIPRQKDSHNCGCFAFMHLRYRVLRMAVKMTSGSGDVTRLNMIHNLLLNGRRYHRLREKHEAACSSSQKQYSDESFARKWCSAQDRPWHIERYEKKG